jgi:hypothetical protein
MLTAPLNMGATFVAGSTTGSRETQRHRSRAEVARFFDPLDMAGPGHVPVQEWRPRSGAEAGARPAMWGGVGRGR